MSKEGVRILPCTCSHEYQDATYGKGLRVHNVNKDGKAFCTVCCPPCRNKIIADVPPNPVVGSSYVRGRGNRTFKMV